MAVEERIEYLEHAGDARIRVRAESLEGLFAVAARALTGIMTKVDGIASREHVPVELRADGPEELLVDWLNELVFLFETRGFLTSACELKITGGLRLQASLHGEPYHPDRHPIEAVIKAATHHGLSIRHGPDGFQAEVVIDL